MGEVITRNLYTRMIPFEFDENNINKQAKEATIDEVRKVIEGTHFIKNEGLHPDVIVAGDIFKKDNGSIYLNIRPDCDCVPDRRREGANNDEVSMYLLTGDKLTSKQESNAYDSTYGHFIEKDNESIVFNIADGKSYKILFKKLEIMKWVDLKQKRIGRLLPPHITLIQQRYALYLQRQGLPRIPSEAIPVSRSSYFMPDELRENSFHYDARPDVLKQAKMQIGHWMKQY